MARSAPLVALAALLVALAPSVRGHGMLIDPPNRCSAWRYGFNVPANYNDNEQFCGGIGTQWNVNGGRCGICGDSYSLPTPRPSENGGTYGTGTIVKTYGSGQTITVTARLTTNHKGRFSFDLCPLSNVGAETENCFQPLQIAQGGTVYELPSFENGEFSVNVVLPAGLRCSQCVLRWTYVAANMWGTCADGSQAAGCGPQETYKTCSDIAIV